MDKNREYFKRDNKEVQNPPSMDRILKGSGKKRSVE
jgi:hypothetical protein